MIRVLLADDHSLVRAGLKSLLEQAPDMQVVAEACDGSEAIEEFKRASPDVVIMDISMPGMDGLEAVKQLLTLDPDVRILVLTMHSEEQYAVRFLRAGVMGYVTKSISQSQLHNAVRAVAQGRQFLSDEGKDAVTLQLLASRSGLAPVENLSDRELQVLCLIARGQELKEVASELHLSVKTVETYRSRILQKLCLRNNADICRFATDKGLIA